MDAHITRERLGNQLSYDWLKMLAAVAAAVAAVVLLFTMIAPRPRPTQLYYVYGYGGLHPATDSRTLPDDLAREMSYEVLETNMENFDSGALGDATFSARRAVSQGNAMFVADYTTEEDGETPFYALARAGVLHAGEPRETIEMFFDAEEFILGCESYLTRFFGEDWRMASEPDGAAVRECFLARNDKDKRFKTEAQREAGIASERERLLSLREDYAYVLDHGFEKGVGDAGSTLTFATFATDGYDTAEGHVDREYTVGFCLGKLSRLDKLYFYYDGEGNTATEKIVLMLLNNGAGFDDLKYESVTLLRLLLERYA